MSTSGQERAGQPRAGSSGSEGLGGVWIVRQLSEHRDPDRALDIRGPVGAVPDEHDAHWSANRLAKAWHEVGQSHELVGDGVDEDGQEVRRGNDRHRSAEAPSINDGHAVGGDELVGDPLARSSP